MTCNVIDLGGGNSVIACSRERKRQCVECKAPASRLCDAKLSGGTCDRPLCVGCAVPAGRGVDLCPRHGDPAGVYA